MIAIRPFTNQENAVSLAHVIIRRIPSPSSLSNQSINQSMRPQTRTLAASGGSVLRAARTMIGLHTILAPVLSRLFSRYVDGISAETLRIGLLSRKLTLSNFTVNVDALDELALPCRVVRVRVDALDLKYAVFGRDPLRATIEGGNRARVFGRLRLDRRERRL